MLVLWLTCQQGFKARGARIRDEIARYNRESSAILDVVGQTLQASLMPLPFKEPSGTLYNLWVRW